MANIEMQSFESVETWILRNSLKGYEPKDIVGTKPFIFLRHKMGDPLKVVTRKDSKSIFQYFLAPFYQTKFFQILVRRMLLVRKRKDPQTVAMLARAYMRQYPSSGSKAALGQTICSYLDWLIDNPSKGYKHLAYGFQFKWPHSPTELWAEGTPQSTMITYAGNAFLEGYELFGKKKYLDAALSCAHFCMEDLNIDHVRKDALALSYSPLDHDHVINVDAHVGALLARLHKYKPSRKMLDFAIKCFNFVVQSQAKDGTWTYRAPPEKYLGPPDNYHTGDILEYLFTFQHVLNDKRYDKAIRKGLNAYINYFFTEQGIPKMSPDSIYPIDIHSSAQSIIALMMLKGYDSRCEPMAKKVAEWTIRNMQDKKGCFYFRKYKTGLIDKTPFMRWNQAWMFYALSWRIH